jgi:hypothetical protein
MLSDDEEALIQEMREWFHENLDSREDSRLPNLRTTEKDKTESRGSRTQLVNPSPRYRRWLLGRRVTM